MRIGPDARIAIRAPSVARHARREGNAVLGTHADRYTERRARATVRAVLTTGVLRCLQVDVALRIQQRLIARGDRTADHVDVAILARARCRDGHVVPCRDCAADSRARPRFRLAVALARPDRDIEANARCRLDGITTHGVVSVLRREACRDRSKRHQTRVAVHVLRGACHLPRGLYGSDNRAAQSRRDRGLPERLLLAFCRGVLHRVNLDCLAGQRQVVTCMQRATGDVQIVARRNAQVAVDRADHASGMADLGRLLSIACRARANHIALQPAIQLIQQSQARQEPVFSFRVVALRTLGILRSRNLDVATRAQRYVIRTHDVAALDRQILAGSHHHRITRHRARHADIGLRALHRAGGRSAHETAALGRHGLVAVVLFTAFVERDITVAGDRDGTRRGGIRAGRDRGTGQRHVPLAVGPCIAASIRTDCGKRRVATGREGRANGRFVIGAVNLLPGSAVSGDVVVLRRVGNRRRRQIAAGDHAQILPRTNLRPLKGSVVAALHGQTAARRDRAALVRRAVGFPVMLAVLGNRLRADRLHGVDHDVMARRHLGIAAGSEVRPVHGQIVARPHQQVARRGDRTLPANQAHAGLAVAGHRRRADGIHQGRVDDVVTGLRRDPVAADLARRIEDVVRRRNHGRAARLVARDGAAPVDDVGGGDDGLRAALDHARVGRAAHGMDLHVIRGDQRAGGLQVVRMRVGQVDDRCQHLLRGAVRQRHGLVDQPDDVAGQRVHLGRRQRDARHQAELLGRVDARAHQRAVLVLVVAVALQIDAPGELRDLVAHQLLFIEAVAQALLNQLRIQVQRAQHVVAGDELRIAGQARIGGDQVGLARRGTQREQAAGRQADVERAIAAGHRLRCIHGGLLGAGRAHRLLTGGGDAGSGLVGAQRAAGRPRRRAGGGHVGVVQVRRVDLDRVVGDEGTARAADRHRRQHRRRLRHRADILVRPLVPRIGRDDVLRLVLIERPADVVDRSAAVVAAADRAALLGAADPDRAAGRDGAVVVVDGPDVGQRHVAAGQQPGLRRAAAAHLVLLGHGGRVASDFDTLVAVVAVAARRILRGGHVVGVRVVGVPVVDAHRAVAVAGERVVVDRLVLAVDVDHQHVVDRVRPRTLRHDLRRGEGRIDRRLVAAVPDRLRAAAVRRGVHGRAGDVLAALGFVRRGGARRHGLHVRRRPHVVQRLGGDLQVALRLDGRLIVGDQVRTVGQQAVSIAHAVGGDVDVAQAEDRGAARVGQAVGRVQVQLRCRGQRRRGPRVADAPGVQRHVVADHGARIGQRRALRGDRIAFDPAGVGDRAAGVDRGRRRVQVGPGPVVDARRIDRQRIDSGQRALVDQGTGGGEGQVVVGLDLVGGRVGVVAVDRDGAVATRDDPAVAAQLAGRDAQVPVAADGTALVGQ